MSRFPFSLLAYNLKPYQMTGDFMRATNEGPQFDIEATMADGATKEAFWQMQADLLKTRFGLKLHFEETQIAGFDLTVQKNKLRVAGQPAPARQPEEAAGFPGPPILDKDGFPTLVNSTRPFLAFMNGRARWIANNCPVGALVDLLEQQLRQPVADSTGLGGQYNFVLQWGTQARRPSDATVTIESIQPGDDPSLPVAVQEQLGLKLISKRVTISIPSWICR